MMTRLAKTVVEPTAKNGFIFTLLGTKWGFLWLWLLIINVAAAKRPERSGKQISLALGFLLRSFIGPALRGTPHKLQ